MAFSSEYRRDQSPEWTRPDLSDLRIVLLGKNTSENNRVGNFILNKNVFGRKTSQPDVETFSERVEGRNITVINITLLKSQKALTKKVQKEIEFSPSEVIILVLQHSDFSMNKKKKIHSVLNCFGQQAMKRTMILTTDDDTCGNKNELIQKLSRECGGGRFQLQNTQRSQILQKVDEIITGSGFRSSSVDQEHRRSERSVQPKERAADSDQKQFGKPLNPEVDRRSPSIHERSNMSDLRIVLLGKNVSENNRVGNVILGTDVLESEPQSAESKLHQRTQRVRGRHKDRHVSVINSPRLLQPHLSLYQISQTVKECVDLSYPGPHAFILVLQNKDFTEEDRYRVKSVLREFSEEAMKRTIVITTDQQSHGPMVSSMSMSNVINQIIADCGGRHLQLDERNPVCQNEIFRKVDEILKRNLEDYLTFGTHEGVMSSSVDEENRGSDYSVTSEEHKQTSHHKDDEERQKRKSHEVSDLRIVLLGKSLSENCRVGNIILGQRLFDNEAPPDQVQRQRSSHTAVINVPHLLQPHLSDHQIREAVRECVSLSDPGPHVIVLLLNPEQCSTEDREHVEKVLNYFCEKVYEHTMVLTTQDTDSDEPTEVNHAIKNIITKCFNRHYQLKKSSSTIELREELEKFGQLNSRRYLVCGQLKSSENFNKQQVTERESPLTITLFGNPASVQFGPENTLLGEERLFKTVETSRIVPVQRKIAERYTSVINMTGLHETDSVDHHIDRLVNENEIQAFIFVVRLGQLTDADKMGLEWLQRVFGDKVLQFVMILFTYEREEECDTIIDDLKRNPVLEQLLEKCGGRSHTCNTMMNNQSEMRDLMEKIERLFHDNQQQSYNGVRQERQYLQKRENESDKCTVNKVSTEGTTTREIHKEMDKKDSKELTSSEQEIPEKIQNLFNRLHLESHRNHKMRAADVLQLTAHTFKSHKSEEELIQTFIHKLLLMDYRARNIKTNKPIHTQDTKDSYECQPSADLLTELFEPDDGDSTSDPLHPMDVQMAVFHCADGFLKQLMVTKLSQCQYALPLLVPDPFTQQIEFPLWTFRQINKSWKIRNSNNETISQTQPICKTQTPMVFFFRFGFVSSSKSQLMNGLINERHNTFFHRNCPGSSRTRVLMDGVVEIAWFCPSGKNTDHFSDCVAFCNLHGDAGDHEKQLQILTEMASVNVVLLPRLDRRQVSNDRNIAELDKLYKDKKPLICIFTDHISTVKETRKGKYKIGLKDRNQSDVSEELRRAINDCLSESSSTFTLEDVSKHSDIRVDEEDDDDCRRGRAAAQQMMSLLEEKHLTEIKESFLPHQGKLWHQWSQKNKELHQIQGNETEMDISRKQTEIKKIREKQHESDISEFMKCFFKEINSNYGNEMFFLKWLRILTDEHTSADLPARHHKYKEKWSKILKPKESYDYKSEPLKAEKTELERMSKDVQASSFAFEHIMREIAQIYESCSSVKKNKKDLQIDFSSLPSLAAEMMISGFPLELMDGDAAHVPVIWISAVLDQLIQKLGDQRVFVLSVLGLQSSGKSTMLNAIFGLQFAVGAGRCTRGAFMQLLRVSDEIKTQMNFDYILVVDTEGLRALELAGRSTRHHDNQLATFVVGLANLTLINIFGENPAEMQDILQIVVQAFMRMKKVRLNPSCVFVHQNVSDVTAGEKNMEGRRRLQETLDKMTRLAAKDEVYDAERFSDVIRFDVQNDVKYFPHLWEGNPPMAPPNPNYCESIQELKETILSHAAKSHGIMLKDLKDRITDLWEALLKERFIFSYRNSLEISAYRKLETEYSKWSWSLRSAILETENKLHNKIENEAINEIEETDLQRELKETSEEVEKSMSEFFEKDTDREILIQWKTSFEIKIKELQENIVRETKRKLNEILQQRDLKKMIDAQRTQHENTLYEKSKELALRLKDKANDKETLKKEFDLFWEKSVNKIISGTPPIKDIDIMRDVKLLLNDVYVGCLPVDHWKEDLDYSFNLWCYSQYVILKKSKDISNEHSQGIFGYDQKLSPADEAQIKSLVTDVAQQTDSMIQSFNISKMGYNVSYIQKLIDYIKTRVTDHQKGPVKYVFKNEFFMDLVLSICKRANKMITDQHRLFREANDPVIYVEKKREEYYSIFKKYCHGAASSAIFGEIICQKLKEPIEQSVYKKTAKDLADEMRTNCESLNGNRSNMEKHILKRLAEGEDFDKYMDYIHNPRDHFKSFIRDEVSRYITDRFSFRVLPKMKENIELLQQKIMKAAQESTEHVQDNSGDLGLWLKSFTQRLSDVLIFSEKDLSGVNHSSADDANLLEDVIRKELSAIMFVISSRFNRETFPSKLDYKFRPDEILIDHFCQCCWVQCPFCGAICTNTIENHDGDHSVPFHRIIGQNGIHYRNTSNLSTHMCTSAIAKSSLYFFPVESEDKILWREYRKAGGVYANWSITPDLSELPYWKWFVCRFQKDLEKYYNNKFEGSGEIPDVWRGHSKDKAIQSLDEYI